METINVPLVEMIGQKRWDAVTPGNAICLHTKMDFSVKWKELEG